MILEAAQLLMSTEKRFAGDLPVACPTNMPADIRTLCFSAKLMLSENYHSDYNDGNIKGHIIIFAMPFHACLVSCTEDNVVI